MVEIVFHNKITFMYFERSWKRIDLIREKEKKKHRGVNKKVRKRDKIQRKGEEMKRRKKREGREKGEEQKRGKERKIGKI